MSMSIWQAISMGSYLLAWYTRASADGVLTQNEVIEGVRGALEVAGVDIQIAVPAPPRPGLTTARPESAEDLRL